jgi:hypothetical protein
MGWKRINGNYYYYQSRRVGNRVLTDYQGSGLDAELKAQLDQEEIEIRNTYRKEWQTQVEQFRQQDQEINKTMMFVEVLTGALLVMSGYHKYKRQWRRKRNERTDSSGK